MGTCYSRRSACYDLTRNHHTTSIYDLKPPETPPATLRRFCSLRHSVKSMSHYRQSLRAKPITIIKQSPRTKHWCLIKYNETKEALV